MRGVRFQYGREHVENVTALDNVNGKLLVEL